MGRVSCDYVTGADLFDTTTESFSDELSQGVVLSCLVPTEDALAPELTFLKPNRPEATQTLRKHTLCVCLESLTCGLVQDFMMRMVREAEGFRRPADPGRTLSCRQTADTCCPHVNSTESCLNYERGVQSRACVLVGEIPGDS